MTDRLSEMSIFHYIVYNLWNKIWRSYYEDCTGENCCHSIDNFILFSRKNMLEVIIQNFIFHRPNMFEIVSTLSDQTFDKQIDGQINEYPERHIDITWDDLNIFFEQSYGKLI